MANGDSGVMTSQSKQISLRAAIAIAVLFLCSGYFLGKHEGFRRGKANDRPIGRSRMSGHDMSEQVRTERNRTLRALLARQHHARKIKELDKVREMKGKHEDGPVLPADIK